MKRLLLDEARWGLAKVWFTWGAALFLLMALQSILGHHGDNVREVWSWFVPTIIPTLALMAGVVGAGALFAQDDVRTVRKNFYDMTWWLSGFYLLILTLTICLEPFAHTGGMELYQTSNYFIQPLQGLVGAAIGLLFTSQQRQANPDGTEGADTEKSANPKVQVL